MYDHICCAAPSHSRPQQGTWLRMRLSVSRIEWKSMQITSCPQALPIYTYMYIYSIHALHQHVCTTFLVGFWEWSIERGSYRPSVDTHVHHHLQPVMRQSQSPFPSVYYAAPHRALLSCNNKCTSKQDCRGVCGNNGLGQVDCVLQSAVCSAHKVIYLMHRHAGISVATPIQNSIFKASNLYIASFILQCMLTDHLCDFGIVYRLVGALKARDWPHVVLPISVPFQRS